LDGRDSIPVDVVVIFTYLYYHSYISCRYRRFLLPEQRGRCVRMNSEEIADAWDVVSSYSTSTRSSTYTSGVTWLLSTYIGLHMFICMMQGVHEKLRPGLSWQKQHSTRRRLSSPAN
jgi:hypothetical protein